MQCSAKATGFCGKGGTSAKRKFSSKGKRSKKLSSDAMAYRRPISMVCPVIRSRGAVRNSRCIEAPHPTEKVEILNNC